MSRALRRSRLVVLLFALAPWVAGVSPAWAVETDKLGGDETPSAEDRGLLEEGLYESPQFGFTVEYGDLWVPETGFGYPLSDPASGQDEALFYFAEVYGEIRVIGVEEGRGGPAADVAHWLDDAFQEERFGEHEVEVLASERGDDAAGAVLFAEVRPGEPEALIHYLQSLVLEDGSQVYLLLVSFAATFEEALAAAQTDLLIDGDGAFDVFGDRAVREALADAPEVTQDAEEAGLAGPSSYEGPAHGHEVAWGGEWTLDPTADVAVRSSLYLAYDELYLAIPDGASDDEMLAVLAVIGDWYIGGDADHYLDFWTDEEVLADYWGNQYTFEVLLTAVVGDQAGALVAVMDGDEVYAYDYSAYVFLREDAMVYLTFASVPEAFEETFAHLTEEITVEGEPIYPFATWDEVEDLLPA